MKSFSILLSFVLLVSCSKPETDRAQNWPSDPEQYGTPYSSVPDAPDASIYQVNMRAFSAQGNLAAVTEELDRIKSLGINVIYLMPIYPVGAVRSVNSPYSITSYTTVGDEFGTLEDLRTLVTTAHQHDMAVILDVVVNHTAWDHPWISNHKSWYQQDAGGNIVSPSGYNDVAQLNFNNDSLQTALIEALRYWVFAANVDGYRFDFADHVPVAFWKKAVNSLRSIQQRKLLLFAEGARNDHFRTGFDLIFGFSFYGNIRGVYRDGRSATQLNTANTTEYVNAFDNSRVVRYTSNHDINLSDGTDRELFGGENGALAAFLIAAYMKGVPMLYNGQEIGYNKRISYFQRDPIDWVENPSVTQAYQEILSFRNESEAVRRGKLFTYSSDDAVVFTKEADVEKVLVIANIRNRTVNYSVPSSIIAASWKNAFSGADVNLNGNLTLAPFEYLVLQHQ